MRLKEIIIRERLYILLLAFTILANFLLYSVNKILEEEPISKIFDKEIPSEEERILDENILDTVASRPAVHVTFLLLSLFLLALLLAGIIIDGLFLCKKIQNENPVTATKTVKAADWGIGEICKVIIIFFFADVVVSQGALALAIFFPKIALSRNAGLMIVATALDIIAVAAIFYFIIVNKRHNLESLGLTAKNFLLNVKYGVMAYVGLTPIFLLITILAAVIFKVLNIPVEPQEVVEILKEEKSVPSLIYMCIFTGVLGPMMEEIFFRGFVYSAIKRKMGILGGISVSALFFAYVHANLASFLSILSLGILLGYIYEKTGSLISSITVHVMHNSVMLLILLFLKTVAG